MNSHIQHKVKHLFDLTNGGKTDFFLKQLNPGLTQTGKIVFDIPKDAEGLFLKS